MTIADKINIFGVVINNMTLNNLVEVLEEVLKEKKFAKIYTPNTEIVMAARKSPELRDELNKANFVIPDGIGLIYGSRLRGIHMKERVTGFDTSMELLHLADKNGYGLYLLGGKEGVAEKAMERLKADYPGIRLTGCHHGYFKGTHTGHGVTAEEKEIIKEIRNNKTDILFVGFGFPRQEVWINTHGDDLNLSVAIGNGGVIDILSGRAKRAPDIFIKFGLEWLYRLLRNPSRIKRQAVLPLFLLKVVIDKNSISEIK